MNTNKPQLKMVSANPVINMIWEMLSLAIENKYKVVALFWDRKKKSTILKYDGLETINHIGQRFDKIASILLCIGRYAEDNDHSVFKFILTITGNTKKLYWLIDYTKNQEPLCELEVLLKHFKRKEKRAEKRRFKNRIKILFRSR